MKNRGRFQAQGAILEESANWAQNLPLLASDAHELLNTLENMISRSEALVRQKGFEKCRKIINDAAENGGIHVKEMGKAFIKSYPTGYMERVDLEVRSGIAFVKKI